MRLTNACFSILNSFLQPLAEFTAGQIANWKYEAPYDAYSFKGDQDDYLLDESTWGTEQFCLMDGETGLDRLPVNLKAAISGSAGR